MKSITVSIFIKKNIYAVLIMKDGKLYTKEVKRILDDNINKSNYNQVLYTLEVAFRLIRNYIENNTDCDDFVIELNNSIVIKWLNKFYSKPDYEIYFKRVLNILQELPISYLFVYNTKPIAKMYANEKYLQKDKLSGIDIFNRTDD